MLKSNYPYTDEELLQLLKQNVAAAFDILFNRYWKALFTAAYSRVQDEDTAKDIVQNLLIEIWQKRESLEINTGLKQYLFGAVKLKVLHYYRSENIKQQVLDNALERMKNIISSTDSLAAYYDLERIVSEEVNEMPVNMKRSFMLRSDSYTIKEIAKNLNLAEQTVSNNITEAVKRLKRRIKVEYPDRYIGCITLFILLFTQN